LGPQAKQEQLKARVTVQKVVVFLRTDIPVAIQEIPDMMQNNMAVFRNSLCHYRKYFPHISSNFDGNRTVSENHRVAVFSGNRGSKNV
jgi:hypothetical protein